MNKRNFIFIRGLTRGQGHWADFISIFQKKDRQIEVECLDLPGNGERFQEASFFDTGAIARDLRSRSRFIFEGKKVNVLGHSLGGMVAVKWAQQFPDDFEKLYLMNTSASNLGPWFQRLNFANLPTLLRLGLTSDAEARERMVLSVIANSRERSENLVQQLAQYSAAHRVSRCNVLRQLVSAARTSFPSRAPVVTEILVSSKDRLVSSTNSMELGKLWQIPVRVHAWGGHDLAIDDPDWMVEQLL